MSKVWLITGVSRGLGGAFTEEAPKAGHRVVATARNSGHLVEVTGRFGDDFTIDGQIPGPRHKQQKQQQGKPQFRARRKSRMRASYRLQIIENCLTCPPTKERQFCNLPPTALERLDAISSSATYPKRAVLFAEGQEPRGVFVICAGRVKLTASSMGGKSLILRIAGPGDVVGLSATISGKPYEVTAESIQPIQANFIPRDAFRGFLRENGEEAWRIAEILNKIYHAAFRQVRYLGLSGSAAAKLAMFLLDQDDDGSERKPSDRKRFTLSHEEIAEIIGTARETVTRALTDFKRKKLIEVRGPMLVVTNRAGLETLADS
jgi:CRP/FNR family transcriptional regulator, cyclic AMP receptor protein